MNIRQLKIFTTIYEKKSITGAAEALGLAQPAVSLSIHELENEYNTKFFEKEGRSIRTTDAGEKFYPDAARLISLYEEMDQELRDWNKNGRLKIGSSISIGACLMPDLLKSFGHIYPDIDLSVNIASSDRIERKLLENRLDFALIEGTVHSDKITCDTFMEDELVPICSRFNPLADRKDVDPEELKSQKFLMREKDSGTREKTDLGFLKVGFKIDPVIESTSTVALINLVAAGIGVSVLPKRMLDRDLRSHRVCTFSVKGVDLKRSYSIIYMNNKTIAPAMQDFFDLARKYPENHTMAAV
ncbi:MAG: LysR family transcriptional regulator [Lachnospiraceae bacterium]|jgi:DNA-binding transcriptional LysR family regulator|nr:LysR family transcriptional regulator [Lachnospiraceae bacterium]MEE3461666.1 LysR family transcriptional regulator [Lachnospiraceae bacterium]